MRKVHWIVSNNMFNEDGFARLLAAFERLGSKYTLVKTIPFTQELTPEPEIDPSERVVVLGTYTLCHIARARSWFPGSFHNDATFDYGVQWMYWKDLMLNDGSLWPLKSVPESLFAHPQFIRPVLDTKSFIGQVMDLEQFRRFRDGVLALLPEDQLVSPKREIYQETRVWIVDHEVVTASLYKFGTLKRYEERGARSAEGCFAKEAHEVWFPTGTYVMDVADTPDGFKIVEVNNLNAAGFYAGDMQKLVGAIEFAYSR
jgi:hypothetical protein